MQCIRHIQRGAPLLTSWGKKVSTCNFQFENLSKDLLQNRISKKSASHSYQFYPFRQGCGFHTSQRHRVHPALWLILKPLFKITAALTGRGVRKWYGRMDSKEKTSFWTAVKKRWYLFTGAAGSLVGLFGIYYWSHIQETPITRRKRFVALTHDQIISIAKSEADSIIETYRDKMFSAKSMQVMRVMDVAKRLLLANPELQKMSFQTWEVFVVQDPVANACVLPTGHVFVFEGMLDMANTQDELAIILGHEMAHALLEHGIEELSHGQMIDYVVIVLMAAFWCIIPNDGIALVSQWFHNKLVSILTRLPHSREIEKEADKVGAMLAAKACFDIRQGAVLWQKMEAVSKMSSTESLPTFLSTHPHNLKRANFFDYIIPQAEKWRDESKCPLWPKNDPREAIQLISKIADNHVAALKTGQNLKRVKIAQLPMARAATATELQVSKTTGGKGETADLGSEDSSVKIEGEQEPNSINENASQEDSNNKPVNLKN